MSTSQVSPSQSRRLQHHNTMSEDTRRTDKMRYCTSTCSTYIGTWTELLERAAHRPGYNILYRMVLCSLENLLTTNTVL